MWTGVLFFSVIGYSKTKLAVIESHEAHPHRKQIEELFKSKLDPAVDVRYINFYEANGDLTEATALKALDDAKSADVIHLSWNLPDEPAFSKIKKRLQQLAGKKILIAAAGAPSGRELSAPLSKTVMGQVPDAFVIGELTKKARPAINSYYGEPLFTALQAPEGHLGSSFSSVLFTVSLVNAVEKDPTKKNWKKHLRARKSSSLKAFPDLKDLGILNP